MGSVMRGLIDKRGAKVDTTADDARPYGTIGYRLHSESIRHKKVRHDPRIWSIIEVKWTGKHWCDQRTVDSKMKQLEANNKLVALCRKLDAEMVI